MSEDTRPDLDALIKIEVDRAVAPYVGKIPQSMIPKLRELSERYWRENPVAMDALRRKMQKVPVHSGPDATGAETDTTKDGAGRKEES